MKLHEFAKKHFSKGLLDFTYVADDEGIAKVKQYDGQVFEQRFSLDGNKVVFGDVKYLEHNQDNKVEKLVCDESIRVRLPGKLKNNITDIAKKCGMSPSTYVRHLIENDINTRLQEERQGYVII